MRRENGGYDSVCRSAIRTCSFSSLSRQDCDDTPEQRGRVNDTV